MTKIKVVFSRKALFSVLICRNYFRIEKDIAENIYGY